MVAKLSSSERLFVSTLYFADSVLKRFVFDDIGISLNVRERCAMTILGKCRRVFCGRFTICRPVILTSMKDYSEYTSELS
jgi:hypothetical protein